MIKISIAAAMLLIVSSSGHSASVQATSAPAQTPKPTVRIRMQLAQRTYPRLKRTSSTKPPGLILYPEYMPYAGRASIYGPEPLLRTLKARLRLAEKDATKLKGTVYVRIVRLRKRGMPIEVKQAAGAIRIHLPKGAYSKYGFDCLFEIPSESVKWVPGRYRMEYGVWYSDRKGTNTIASAPIYFEVRSIEKGSGDEINLLTNALLREIPGLADRVLADKNYTERGLAGSILALDPHDVFARHALIRKAILLDADPGRAVKLWKAIQKDVADGKAHRAESLINPLHSLRLIPATKKILGAVVRRGLRTAEATQERFAAAQMKVNSLVRKGNYSVIVEMIATGGKGLWSVDNIWPAVLAIRAVRDARLKVAHETLIKELSKLKRFPGLFQREIVDALASIHADDKHGNLRTRPWKEGIVAIEWWLSHPSLDNDMMPSSATAPGSK